jgi:cytoskeletal protein RodZ
MPELKRKVTLKRKTGATGKSPPPLKKSNKKWQLWSLFAIVAVGVVVFVLIKYSSPNDASNNGKTQTEQTAVSEQSSSTESATKGTTPKEESATTESSESGSNEQAATPASPEAKPAESKPAESKPAAPAQSAQAKDATLSGTLEEKAKRVIRGDFGNGAERKRQLGNAYAEIQRKVNEMYRNGEVY